MGKDNAGLSPEEAQALVAGPLGHEMEKFPLRFCKPIYFGLPPSREHPEKIINGTVALLRTNEKFFGVTCEHVIQEYRRKKKEDGRCLLAISNLHLDDLSRLVAEDDVLDYAVFELTAEQVREITKNNNGIGEAFYEVNRRCPPPLRKGDFVAFGGFPGELRKQVRFNELNFGSYSSGACRVTDTHADWFSCKFERDYWIRHFSEPEPKNLGGLSGGPAFAMRRPSGLCIYEFTGWVYQIHPDTETLIVRHASAIWNVLYDRKEA